MKNILHRHKYKIIGTCDNRDIFDGKINGLHVDIMCKCSKCGTVIVPETLRNMVLAQAAKGKYLNVPYIMSAERLM